jgi:hypothetical protein
LKSKINENYPDFVIGGGNKITQANGVYEKTSNTGWNADVTSSKGFVNNNSIATHICQGNLFI